MAILEGVKEQLEKLKGFSPAELRKLANERLSDAVVQEVGRARTRVLELEQRYPSAGLREKAQRLVDSKKNAAGLVGGISGVFGLASVPADLMVMTWLQLSLLVDIATLYKVNLKNPRARADLLDLFGYANGIGPLERAGPKVVGKLAGVLLEKGGLKTIGRALPVVAAPLTAYLNNQHIQTVGDEAVRFYEGFAKAKEKTRNTGSA
ncbi:MAG TPA: EcsC family protein [Myxococcaceae bacterium]|nr:EcsC family protein [Myxococcaceae bacterium]